MRVLLAVIQHVFHLFAHGNAQRGLDLRGVFFQPEGLEGRERQRESGVHLGRAHLAHQLLHAGAQRVAAPACVAAKRAGELGLGAKARGAQQFIALCLQRGTAGQGGLLFLLRARNARARGGQPGLHLLLFHFGQLGNGAARGAQRVVRQRKGLLAAPGHHGQRPARKLFIRHGPRLRSFQIWARAAGRGPKRALARARPAGSCAWCRRFRP